jgi:hypothetical protein
MKTPLIIFLLVILVKAGFGQYSLTFCENVNNDGKPVMASNSFLVNKTGSALRLLLKSDAKLGTDQMDFKIFYINDNGKEQEVTKFPTTVKPNWDYVWKEVVFFDAGNYRVKVYNSKGNYLTSANLNVKQQ